MVFVGEVSGATSTTNPTRIKLSRLTPDLKIDSYHVADKDLLTIYDLKQLIVNSMISQSTSKDLATLLADYHMPTLTGHSIVIRENALREKLIYYPSAKVYDKDATSYENSENPENDDDSGTSDLFTYIR